MTRLVSAWLVMSSAVALADQFVLTEVTYTHSATTTTDSHYRVDPLPGTPSNWVSPIDYSHGTAVVRLQVFTKPTTTATRYQICFEATPSYACTDQAPAYTTPGVYTWTTSFTNFYQYNQVDWSQGTRRVALILKDTMNVKPAPENVGATVSALYMPTDLRVTVTIVSPGGTYVPPDAGFDAGMVVVDAGTPDADFDAGGVDAGTPDAGTPDSGIEDVDAGEEADAGVETPSEPSDEGVRGSCSTSPVAVLIAVLCWLRRRYARAR
ncbi:MAG: hypothetical protein QM817_31660 [Archangium sp.]